MAEEDLRYEFDTVDIKLNDYQRSNLLFLLQLVTCKVGPFKLMNTGAWASEICSLLDEADVLAFPSILKSFSDLIRDLYREGCSIDPTNAQEFQSTLDDILERHRKTAQRLGYPHAQELSAAALLELEQDLKEMEEQDPEIKKASERVQSLFHKAMERFQESIVQDKLVKLRHSIPFLENRGETQRRLKIIQEIYKVKAAFEDAGDHFSLAFIHQAVEAIISGDWEEVRQIEEMYAYKDDPKLEHYRERHTIFRALFSQARTEVLPSHTDDFRIVPGGRAKDSE